MTQHETKTYRAEIKAVGGTKADPSGAFEALVSVFDNVDLGGDRVLPGAFTETLSKWAAKGDPIPVIWSHEWDDPESHIGVVINAQETPDGLLVQAQLDVANNERAKYVARLLAERRVTQFSFGYYAKEWDVVEDPNYGPVRELKAVDLFEVGPTLLGMNPATQLVQAASALTRSGKAGRVLSSTNEQLIRAAYTALEEVLAGLGSPEEPGTDPQQSGKSAEGKVGPNPQHWVVGAPGDLPTTDSEAPWDSAAAEQRVFAWAGWDENPDPAKARQAFLLYDENNAELRGAYHLCIADVVDGELLVFPSAIRRCASYLPRTDVPQFAIDAAREVIDHYEQRMGIGGKSADPDVDVPESSQTEPVAGDTTPTITHERLAELLILSEH